MLVASRLCAVREERKDRTTEERIDRGRLIGGPG